MSKTTGSTDPRTALAGAEAPTDGTILAPGDTIGGYALEEVVGTGGMGVVFRARDIDLGRTVAVKVIAPERARDPGFRELFLGESRAAASLEHPNVLPVYRAGEDGGHLYAAMRFVRGSSLRAVLVREGRLSAARACRIVAHVGSALDAAHAAGIAHRDVKPGNILLATIGDEEHAYLADFGLAGSGSLPAGSGTPGYIAPPALSEREGFGADVYALGKVLVACLTGDQDAPGASAPQGLPSGFDNVLRRALAEDPATRYPSAGEFARELLALRYDLALVASPAQAGVAADLARRLTEHDLDTRVAGSDADDILGLSSGCALLIGPDGLGPWARPALARIEQLAERDRGFKRLAVLLPGAPAPGDPSLAILGTWSSIDLRDGLDDAGSSVARAVRGPALGLLGVASDTCPYLGLASFEEEDAERFVGRERDVDRLVEHLRTSRFVVVLGPSGSGKSSLVKAGLVPALRRGALPSSECWPIEVIRPGANPLEAFAAAAARLGAPRGLDLLGEATALDTALNEAESERAVLVVDQFEEIFTLCADHEARRRATEALAYAATVPAGKLMVILAMRADFYARLADHDALRDLAADNQYLVGPMRAEDLRRAIEFPARQAGLTIEPGLTRTLIEDVDDRPGALPLLSHVLVELWRRRRGRELTLEAYAATGGVDGALARRADTVVGELGSDREGVVRRIMLRLTQPGEGTEDTRRRATFAELDSGSGGGESREVVSALSEARLLTVGRGAAGEPTVEMAHEALVRSWPRLRTWIGEDREGLRLQRQLTDSAAEWERSGGDEGRLYRGAQLSTWLERDRSEISDAERRFLDASSAQSERETLARRRRTRVAISSLGGGLAAVAGLASFAFVQRNAAATDRDRALSRQIAGSAREQLSADPELSQLLAQRAYEVSPTVEAEEILRQSAFASLVRAIAPAPDGVKVLDTVAARPGEVASGYSDGTIRRWDAATGRERGALRGHRGAVTDLAQGRVAGEVLSGGEDGTIRRWIGDVGAVVARPGGRIAHLAASRRAARAVVVSGDNRLSVVDLDTGRTMRRLKGLGGGVTAVAITPDGRTIVAGDDRGEVRRWDRSGSTVLRVADERAAIDDIDISPDGTAFVNASASGVERRPLFGSRKPVITLLEASTARFDPSGRFLIVGKVDSSATVLDGKTLARLVDLRGAHGRVAAADFGGTSEDVVTVSEDGLSRAWRWRAATSQVHNVSDDDYIPQGQPHIAPDGSGVVVLGSGRTGRWQPRDGSFQTTGGPTAQGVAGYAVARDGLRAVIGLVDAGVVLRDLTSARDTVLVKGTGQFSQERFVKYLAIGPTVAIAGEYAGDVRVWKLPGEAILRVPHRHPQLTALAMRPDESGFATGGSEGVVRLWSVKGTSLIRELPGHSAPVLAVGFSPDGTLIASAGADRAVLVRDLDGKIVGSVRGLPTKVNGVSFSPDGDRLSVASDDGLFVWDWRRGVVLTRLPVSEPTYAATFDGRDGLLSFGDGDSGSLLRKWRCETCSTLDAALARGRRSVTRTLTPGERATFHTE